MAVGGGDKADRADVQVAQDLCAEAHVNIATFNLGRTAAGGDAICLVGVDQALTDPQMAAVRALPHVKEARVLNF